MALVIINFKKALKLQLTRYFGVRFAFKTLNPGSPISGPDGLQKVFHILAYDSNSEFEIVSKSDLLKRELARITN